MGKAWLLPLILCAPLLMALVSVPLELPAPIHLPDDAEASRVPKALAEAFANKKWTVESQTERSVTAKFEANGRTLRVRLDYDDREISFHYVDSQELGYFEEQGSIFLLPKANKWLQQLDGSVRAQVRALSRDAPPVEVVPLEPEPAR